MPDYGSLVTAADVDDAVLGVIQPRLQDYLDWVAERADVELTFPRAFAVRQDLELLPEDLLPTVAVATTDATFEKDSLSGWSATWVTEVGVFDNRRDPESSRRAVMRTIAAIRVLLMHQPSLQGFASRVDVGQEGFSVVAFEDSRTLAGASVLLEITTDVAADIRPPTDVPVVLSHHEEVIPRIGEP